MGRRTAAVVPLLAALLLAGCSPAPPPPAGPEGILATLTTPPRSTPPRSSTGPVPATPSLTVTAGAWYLALGDSLAAGQQPTTGDQPTRGYAGAVLQGLTAAVPGIALNNLGCSGETTTTMLRGGPCRYAEGSQLAAAAAFLKANGGQVRLVTLDIGANNVLPCAKPAVDQACAASAIQTVATELAGILGQLRAAAPQSQIVVLTYYNPLLAAWRQGANGQQLATQSQPLLDALNAQIADEGKAVGAKVADVAGAFATAEASGSPEPTNVTRICDWTWMCGRGDIHANDEGYAAMAKAVLAAR